MPPPYGRLTIAPARGGGKPLHATALSVCVALVFPALLLGGLWSFGLDGIRLNMFGTAVLSSILGFFLLGKIRETRKSAE